MDEAQTTPVAEPVIVHFRLRDTNGASHACVVGEFNDWSRTANPMDRDGDDFTTTIALAPGCAYRFRYLLDGQRWENDWAADAYVPNDCGGEDSVIDLTDPANSRFTHRATTPEPAHTRHRLIRSKKPTRT